MWALQPLRSCVLHSGLAPDALMTLPHFSASLGAVPASTAALLHARLARIQLSGKANLGVRILADRVPAWPIDCRRRLG